MTREHDGRWMRCAGRDGARRAIPFDPVVEGARHGLSRELSLALWKLVREEGATAPEQADLERAKPRFHELAVQLAARGAKLRPDVGRLTRVAVELDGVPTARAALDALRPHVPGRETQVIVEARRWASLEPQLEAATRLDPAAQPAPVVTATRPGLPGAEAVASALAELSLPAPSRPEVLDVSVASRMSQMFGVDLSRVRITTNSPAATGATKAVTKDGQVHFRAGAYRPGTRDGDWLIAHELAHVVQQRGAGERTGSTKEIEREADRAASLAVRGRMAPIGLRAQPAAAYAFSDSEVNEDIDVDAEAPQDHSTVGDAADSQDASLAEVSAVLPADATPPALVVGVGDAGAKPNKEPPSIAASRPEAGLAQLRGVRPDRLSLMLGQVRTAASADVSKQRAERETDAIARRVVSREKNARVPMPARRTFVDLIAGSARADTCAVASPDHLQSPMLASMASAVGQSGTTVVQRQSAEAPPPSIASEASRPGPVDEGLTTGAETRASDDGQPTAVIDIARAATEGAGGELPFRSRIQAAFGRQDVSNVQAHAGGLVQRASATLGARASAIGEQVAFRELPDLRTAAHEAAHVVQQREGVVLQGAIDTPGDAFELHADAVADAVVSGKSAESLLTRMPRAIGNAGAATQTVQRDTSKGAKAAQEEANPFHAPDELRFPAATLHRSGEEPVDDTAAHGPPIAAALARRGAGDALPATLRRDMEAVLRADLSRVRVHTDAVAGTAARTIRARAFTIGADIFFAPGAFEPASDAGRELLAHELTHVVQAQEGRVAGGGGGLRISDPDEAAEREAEQVAHRVRSAPRRDLAQSALAFVATAFAPAPAPAPAFVHGMAVFRAPATGGGANAVVVPDGGKPVNEIDLVARDQEPQLRMRSSMSTANDSNILATLPFNTRVQVMQAFPGDWLLVATAAGRLGYCARQYIWYAPEHKLPEPNAKLHKVEGGTAGFAISIAQHYYGDIANKWGTDLRFFVNVLGAVNHLDVPDTTSGWKTVQFKAGTYIWIPSADFAKSLHGVLNSGSRTYNLASALGIAGFLERAGQLYTDFKDAIALSGKYLPGAIAKHAEESILGILESLMWMAIGAVALLAITTAVGAAIGALAGGALAAPGAAAGFEVGLALLDWIGLAFLVKWIGSAIVRIGSTFGTFFSAVWNARGDKGAIDAAARAFAEAIGTLVGVLLEALVMWAISAGVKQAVPKIAETPIGRAFGKTKLGEWLDARIQSYKAGEAPILGPKQALRRLLELRRRSERGEEGEKPPKSGDAYDKLAEKHGLDDVVTQILREQQIDPALVERLLAKKMDPFDIAETALDFGGDGLRAIETMVKANVQPRAAMAVLSMARDMGIGEQVIALVNSGKLENLQGLKKFMTEISQELSQMDPVPGNWHTGKFNELMEAYRRAVEQGHDVSVGGNAAAKGGKPAGKADVIDYTAKQALQSKTVTSPKLENVVENLQKAVDQLNGEHGELPPDGYQRIADIIIENPKNELFQASREQIAAALKGKVHGLENLSPKDTTPGVVRVKNAISTFLFQPSELR